MKLFLGSCLLVLFSAAAHAQAPAAFPVKPVRIVVPFSPASYGDNVARVLGERLERIFKQPFLIDNRAGAGGVIGTAFVARAPADGYTLLLTSSSPLVVNPLIDKSVSYDPLKDFEPIAILSTASLLLVTAPDFPAKSLPELLAVIRKEPGRYSFATNGNGSYSHMAAELFMHLTRTEMVHVPYKGPAAAETDVMGGQVSMMFDGTPTATQLVKAGRLRPYGISSATQDPIAPDQKPMRQQGVAELKDFAVTSWAGLLAPRGTPPEIVAQLKAGVREILADPEFRARALERSMVFLKPEQSEGMAASMRAELDSWRVVVKAARITLD